jgi:hypothetical protein
MSKLVYPSTKTPPEETPAKSSKGKKPVKKGNILTCCPDCSSDSTTVEDKPLDDVLVPVTLLHRFAKDRSVTAIAQLDTAASSKKKDSTEEINAISREVVRRIVEVGGVTYESPARLCGFGSTCKTYKQAIDLNVSLLFNPSADDIVEMGTLTFQVTDSLPNADLLIGWQSLKNHRILCRCHNNIADRVVAPLTHIMSYKQFKFAQSTEPTDDQSETASVSDHTDTESVDSTVPSAQLPRKGYVCSINAIAPESDRIRWYAQYSK